MTEIWNVLEIIHMQISKKWMTVETVAAIVFIVLIINIWINILTCDYTLLVALNFVLDSVSESIFSNALKYTVSYKYRGTSGT